MEAEYSHLSDEQLLQAADGELSEPAGRQVRTHLEACWRCRSRRSELEKAAASFVQARGQDGDLGIPPAAGPRALLKLRLAELSAEKPSVRQYNRSDLLSGLALGALVLGLGTFLARSILDRHPRPPGGSTVVVSMPISGLTPGATLLLDRNAVCAEGGPNNKAVPVALQRRVFAQYGIRGSDAQAYEVDYLVTPALGGAEDIRNLWPHSYTATVWNAKVKDALETRLREMVCSGSLELGMAQREIAGNWIAAYKKYFNTEMPLPEHEN